MAISELRLKEWSESPPESEKSKNTYKDIRDALERSVALRGCDVYLQGSYANRTNIEKDSDVDVVVQRNSTSVSAFQPLVEELRVQNVWSAFYKDVLKALKDAFPPFVVEQGKKSIKVKGGMGRVSADVVPCLQYKNFFAEGICFWTPSQAPCKKIENFPKVHKRNGEDKNIYTNGMYKDLVRIVKNIKKCLVEERRIDPKIAPSYFIECMIYNVPDSYFQNGRAGSLEKALDFIFWTVRTRAFLLRTVSKQHELFGSEPWQWKPEDAMKFFSAVRDFYNSNRYGD